MHHPFPAKKYEASFRLTDADSCQRQLNYFKPFSIQLDPAANLNQLRHNL
jgi:hypothetical protein